MKKLLSLLAVLTIFALSGCSANNAVTNDSKVTNDQLQTYQANQPVPHFDWSQYRQTVIDVETAEVNGVATTTFMMNFGVDPISSCPSIGFPVASTAQLTNPEQITYANLPMGSEVGTISQAEPNGVYTGTSSGTYVVCVSPAGAKYIVYWEGAVFTLGGPAHWDFTKHSAVLDGDPTVTSTQKKK
jgi:hypothetical protein